MDSGSVELIRFEESWKNELTLLWFRSAIWVGLGLTAILVELAFTGTL